MTKPKLSRPLWIRLTVWVYFILLIIFLGFGAFIWKSGELLVRSDSFGHARWAVVLAGEGMDMARSQAALSLFQQGRFDSLILSGPRVFKTHHESEFTSEWLISQGFPKDRIFQLPLEGGSTIYEAETIIRQARLLDIDTLLIITSNYHSARADQIYQRLAGSSPQVRVYAAEDPFFNPQAWWSWRQSRVTWFLEWAKTLNTKWELREANSLNDSKSPILLEPNPRVSDDSNRSVSTTATLMPVDTLSDSISLREMNQIRK